MMNIWERSSPFLLMAVLVSAALLAAACTGESPMAAETVVQSQKLTQPAGTAQIPASTLAPGAPVFPTVTWNIAPPCGGQADCPSLYVTQQGQVQQLNQSAQGFRAAAAQPEPPKTGRYVIDTGSASPDGQWAAFTSLGYETGGPLFLENLQSGEWINLIEAINAGLGEGQPPLPEDGMWEVIGWFPDGARVLIGSADTSSVVIVNLKSYEIRRTGYPGGGLGGAMFTHLAPDGSRFLFAGINLEGEQVLGSYDLESGEISILKQVPFEEGVVYFPRISPDGQQVAYLLQKGQPDSGISYSINLLPSGSDTPQTLVDGNLGMTTLAWSPDGDSIAFTKKDQDAPDIAAQGIMPQVSPSNVWVVAVDGGQQTQITFIDGQARSPVWAYDGKTLAFVTHDGQVGLASTDQPGQVWQAAGPSPDAPELTSVFFVP